MLTSVTVFCLTVTSELLSKVVTLTYYRLGQTLRAPGGWGLQTIHTIGTWRW